MGAACYSVVFVVRPAGALLTERNQPTRSIIHCDGDNISSFIHSYSFNEP